MGNPIKVGDSFDLGHFELKNLRFQLLASDPSSPAEGWSYVNSASHKLRVFNGTTWDEMGTGGGGSSSPLTTKGDIWAYSTADARLPIGVTNKMVLEVNSAATFGMDWVVMDHTWISDFDTQVRTSTLNQMTAPTADLSINSHKLTNVTNPTSAQDAATKAYVDLVSQGFDFKASVRAVSVANATLATAYENGDTLDGLTLATGDRILLSGQTAAAENGIYTVAASGAPTRAVDADASGEISPGAFVPVEAGTAGANSVYYCTATGASPWVPGTSTSTWSRFTSIADLVAGAGLTKTGNTIDVVATNTSLTVNANDVGVNQAVVPYGYSALIGDGSTTDITVTHSLGTKKVLVSVVEVATDDMWIVAWNATSTSAITVSFLTAPTTNQFRVTVLGIT